MATKEQTHDSDSTENESAREPACKVEADTWLVIELPTRRWNLDLCKNDSCFGQEDVEDVDELEDGDELLLAKGSNDPIVHKRICDVVDRGDRIIADGGLRPPTRFDALQELDELDHRLEDVEEYLDEPEARLLRRSRQYLAAARGGLENDL